jgi:hypothetical protein
MRHVSHSMYPLLLALLLTLLLALLAAPPLAAQPQPEAPSQTLVIGTVGGQFAPDNPPSTQPFSDYLQSALPDFTFQVRSFETIEMLMAADHARRLHPARCAPPDAHHRHRHEPRRHDQYAMAGKHGLRA